MINLNKLKNFTKVLRENESIVYVAEKSKILSVFLVLFLPFDILFMFLGAFVIFVYSDISVIECVNSLLAEIVMFFLAFKIIKDVFFTKVVLTNQRILVSVFSKIQSYEFVDITELNSSVKWNQLNFKAKNHSKNFIDIDGSLFEKEFLMQNPDFVSRQPKINYVAFALILVFTFLIFFTQLYSEKEVQNRDKEFISALTEESFKHYFMDLHYKVIDNAQVENPKQNLKTIIEYSLNSDGTLGRCGFAVYSHDKKFDNEVLSAVKNSVPFASLPKSAQDKSPLTMRFNIQTIGNSAKVWTELMYKNKALLSTSSTINL